MKLATIVTLLLTLTACTPTHYMRQQWATMPVDQANAECLDAVQTTPTRSHPRCMEAKGWKPVY